jgi:hypothetical protein
MQDAGITEHELCRRMAISRGDFQRMTLSKRIGEAVKERAATALELPLNQIFNNRLKKIWSLHHPFSRDQLCRFAGLN